MINKNSTYLEVIDFLRVLGAVNGERVGIECRLGESEWEKRKTNKEGIVALVLNGYEVRGHIKFKELSLKEALEFITDVEFDLDMNAINFEVYDDGKWHQRRVGLWWVLDCLCNMPCRTRND